MKWNTRQTDRLVLTGIYAFDALAKKTKQMIWIEVMIYLHCCAGDWHLLGDYATAIFSYLYWYVYYWLYYSQPLLGDAHMRHEPVVGPLPMIR
jgi:hypothetical protein